ncbi:amidase family protein [Nesterenkonia sp. NBAIMH1]|uniref:amidase family protein n=1 Tax=Nesterenkonia sp. NBAIMH1 TaxID=2600320 RepID=UPI0011B46110|nr:amidase family protein [Nesterenkonia sp. NBAIMH1]
MKDGSIAAPSSLSPLGMNSEELRQNYTEGSLSPVEVLEDTFARIDSVNGDINAIAFRNDSEAYQQAQASARRWRKGAPLSALDGMPISIKDSINAVGTPWRHGSQGHEQVPPAAVDSPPVARLKEGGAVVFAKTTMPDFGMAASGVSSLYGIVRNPWNLSLSPGGSSAGAGASLAAGIGIAGVGTDIAGSVRLPAAHCGLFALKPTQGRIPHLAPSTVRSPGPMARSVREGAELFELLTQPDRRDYLSLPPSSEKGARELAQEDIRDLKVGLLLDIGYGETLHPSVERVVRQAAESLQEGGAQVAEMRPLFSEDPYRALDRLFQVRARTEWWSIPEEKRSQVLPAISEWCAEADGFTAVQHESDQHAVLRSAATVIERFDAYDVVLSPVLPGLGYLAEMVGLDHSRPLAHCSYTCWANQTGQPAASVAFGMEKGLPVAVQVLGKRFDDERVIGISEWLEANRPVEMCWPVAPNSESPIEETFFAGAARIGGSA